MIHYFHLKKVLKKIEKAFFLIDDLKVSKSCDFNCDSWIDKCYQNLNDDINTPKLIANIFEIVKFIFEVKNDKMKIDKESKTKIKNSLIVFVEEILGLYFTKKSSVNLDDDLIELIKEIRNIERDKKNYKLSDLIRDRLNSLGINIEDNK